VLGHIVDRISRGAGAADIVIATSSDPSDDPIAGYCRRAGLACYRGPLDDVAGRFLACAEAQGWEFAARVNGDNLFADPDTLRSMLAIAGTGNFDFVTNVPDRTFPAGMSVEIVRVAFYRQVMSTVDAAGHREHVTSWFYEHPELGRRFVFRNETCEAARGLQLALDTEEDLRRAVAVFGRMTRAPASYGMAEVVRLATTQPAGDPFSGKSGPLLIAEIGGNHEGDFEYARELTRLALETGVDCIKFQIYTGDSLVNAAESPDRNAHFKKFELTPEQHVALAQQCEAGGAQYLASVWDVEALDWIDQYLRMYKIGSGDLTAWPLLREFARRGKPIILSTGLATLEEVLQSVEFLQSVDSRYREPEMLCLLQCTSMYPIAEAEANLRVMEQLEAATGLSVGYSDHTEGQLALRVAAAMGARVLEFHFTDRREGRTFRDHRVSLTPDELVALQEDLRRIRDLRGARVKQPQASEVTQGHVESFRRAAYLSRAVEPGEVIGAADLRVLRPNHGIDARDADSLAGRRARRSLAALAPLSHDDFDSGDELA
jgi:sialic acid synthase SpsE/spore coat polysaccharide biosynthesis protein SpsF (cytidylyltransferase family)